MADLQALLDRPREVVTREELRKKLWPEDKFVDVDHSLSAAVKRLRAALSDSADQPRYIETLAPRGYRIVAPVTTLPLSPKVKSRCWFQVHRNHKLGPAFVSASHTDSGK